VVWLWRFRSFCTPEAAVRSTRFLRDRVRENSLLIESIAQETSQDFGWQRNGVMALYTTEPGFAEGLRDAAALAELEISSQQLDVAEVALAEPRITDSVIGGILFPEDAHLDPGLFVEAVAGLARARGARLDEGIAVHGFRGAHRVEAIETSAGTMAPEVVVLAGGAWSQRLARGLRLNLPIEPGKGFSLTYAAAGEVFTRPLRLAEVRTVVSSMGDNVRITSKLDLVGLDTRVRERRVLSSANHAARYVGLPPGLDRARPWAGLRPLTPDGLPLLGRSRTVENLVLATGHGHLGISLAAITGEMVAGIVAGDSPVVDLGPLVPERFDA
jgi:D-amino-acid dehydrogenase